MGRLLNIAVCGVLILTSALVGCGGSDSPSQSSAPANAGQTASTTTGAQTSSSTPGKAQAPTANTPKEHIPKVTIRVSSPAFKGASPISAQYTCDGANMSPPMQWTAIPQGTAELVLFILNLNSPPGNAGPLIYWAVAGLDPTLHGIPAGKLPPGAIVGRNSLGQSRYTICPAKSDGMQHYVAALFALQHAMPTTPGFNANALYKAVSNAAEYKGLTIFSYQRN